MSSLMMWMRERGKRGIFWLSSYEGNGGQEYNNPRKIQEVTTI